VEYVGTKFVRVTGRQDANIPTEKVGALIEQFYAIDYFSLKDSYKSREFQAVDTKTGKKTTFHEAISDMPTEYTSISVDGRTKKIEDYYFAPSELKRIEEMIDEVAGTKKWVFTDAETLKTLIQSGWDIGKLGQDYLNKAVNWKDAELVRILLAAGVNVNDPSKAGWPILFQAAARPGNAEVLKVLIQAGANVNVTNEVGTTALHLSARSGDPEGLKVLILAGAKLDAQTSYGGTALMEAVLAGKPENLRILLAAGASPALRNREARSVLDYAEKWMQIDPERGGFDVNPEEHAATRLQMVNALKQAGATK
jgi:hypothetical protein